MVLLCPHVLPLGESASGCWAQFPCLSTEQHRCETLCTDGAGFVRSYAAVEHSYMLGEGLGFRV